jgi:hypothetical protein
MRGIERKSRLFWGVLLVGCMSLTGDDRCAATEPDQTAS